ncbi:putative F-box-like domain superfamily protein [Dioscorea sansibarensis]
MGLSPSRYSVSQMAATAKEKEVVEIQKRKRNDGGGTQHQAPRKRVQVGEAGPVVQRPRKRESEKAFSKVQTRARRLTIGSCTSPGAITTNFLAPHSSFIWYEADTWTEVAKYLDGKSLVSLGLANRWFHHLIMQENIWRYAYLRDLQVPLPLRPAPFQWSNLYASAFGKLRSHPWHPRVLIIFQYTDTCPSLFSMFFRRQPLVQVPAAGETHR